MNPLLITLGVLVAVVVVANLHTLVRMVGALVFSHRRHLLRAVAKLDTVKAEGYLQTLKSEVNLMVEMVSRRKALWGSFALPFICFLLFLMQVLLIFSLSTWFFVFLAHFNFSCSHFLSAYEYVSYFYIPRYFILFVI